MKLNLIGLLAATLLSACANMSGGPKFQQGGSDVFVASQLDGRAVVVIDSEAHWQGAGNMTIAFARLPDNASQDTLYSSKNWEFATYPGAAIPFYASESPHGIWAYAIRPGKYAAIRCVWQAPEDEYCPANRWTSGGRTVGMAYFEVTAGEVVNVGKLRVTRVKEQFGKPSKYSVAVEPNAEKALTYLREAHPDLAEKLVSRPLEFSR